MACRMVSDRGRSRFEPDRASGGVGDSYSQELSTNAIMSQSEQPQNGGQPEQVKMQHLSARVPEQVGRGAFSTGVIVMTGQTEFILDFIQNIGGPPSVVTRDVMPHGTLAQFAEALRKNLEMFTQRFGPPPVLPKGPPPAKPQTAQEIYDELKIPDAVLSGSYANGVMIGQDRKSVV